MSDSKFPDIKPVALLHSIFIVQTVIFVIAGLILIIRGDNWWRYFSEPWSWNEQLAIGLIIGLISPIVLTLISFYSETFREIGEPTEFMLRTLKPGLPLIIALSFISGFGEELLFRAALQPMIGVWFTALLFALAHCVVPLKPKTMFIFAGTLFVAGVWIGVLYEKAGLLASITFHCVHNFGAFVLGLYFLNRQENSSE